MYCTHVDDERREIRGKCRLLAGRWTRTVVTVELSKMVGVVGF